MSPSSSSQSSRNISLVKRLMSKSGFFTFQLLVLTVMMLVIAWWGYTQVMKKTLGRFSLFNIDEIIITGHEEDLILLLNPVRTEKFLKDAKLVQEGEGQDSMDTDDWPWIQRNDPWSQADTLWYAQEMRKPQEKDNPFQQVQMGRVVETFIVEWWEKTLDAKDIKYRIIHEPDLVNIYKGHRLLIMPGALLLSEAEKIGIKDFVSDGGSLLTCWSAGCRDEGGKWVGFNFMSQLIGGVFSGSIKDPAGGTNAILKGRSPITATIPPGTHLDFYTYNGYATFDIIESRTSSEAFLFKPYWHNRSGRHVNKKSVIARGSYIEGRFVWFSFLPETVQERYDNNTIIETLALNAVEWLKRHAVARAKVWPSGYTAGGALLLNAKGSTVNIDRIVSEARNSDVIMDMIVEDEYASKSILADNPIEGEIILSTQAEKTLLGRPIRDQLKWMNGQIEWIKKLTGKRPTGLFPIDWQIDAVTLQAVAKTNIRYLLADNTPRCYGPQVKAIRSGVLWRLLSGRIPVGTMPKTQLTLREWSLLKGVHGSDKLYNAMCADISRIHKTSGIYLGILDPDIIIQENAVDLPVKLAAKMDELYMWRTSAKELIERYSAWRGIRVMCMEKTARRAVVRLSNEGKIPIKNVEIEVYLTGDIDRVDISSEMVGTTPTNIRWNKDKGICTFTIPNLGPGDNASLFLDKIKEKDMDL